MRDKILSTNFYSRKLSLPDPAPYCNYVDAVTFCDLFTAIKVFQTKYLLLVDFCSVLCYTVQYHLKQNTLYLLLRKTENSQGRFSCAHFVRFSILYRTLPTLSRVFAKKVLNYFIKFGFRLLWVEKEHL